MLASAAERQLVGWAEPRMLFHVRERGGLDLGLRFVPCELRLVAQQHVAGLT
jgi:hypothetical protein